MNTPVWDDGGWKPLPRLAGTVRADVCVIGLGGSGLAALDELTSQGVSAVGARAAARLACGRPSEWAALLDQARKHGLDAR